jgi:hypothetical protein
MGYRSIAFNVLLALIKIKKANPIALFVQQVTNVQSEQLVLCFASLVNTHFKEVLHAQSAIQGTSNYS